MIRAHFLNPLRSRLTYLLTMHIYNNRINTIYYCDSTRTEVRRPNAFNMTLGRRKRCPPLHIITSRMLFLLLYTPYGWWLRGQFTTDATETRIEPIHMTTRPRTQCFL
jgi:hypothetical protein